VRAMAWERKAARLGGPSRLHQHGEGFVYASKRHQGDKVETSIDLSEQIHPRRPWAARRATAAAPAPGRLAGEW
jgi:hypothetical protein